MKRAEFAAIAWIALGLAGCQAPQYGETVLSEGPPAFETGILSSNELNRLGRQNLASGNSGLAERQFREAVEKNKDDGPSWIGLAAAYDTLGRFELADRAYAEAIAIQGETLPIVNNLGYSYLLRGDLNKAQRYFERAKAMDPNNPVIRNNIRMLKAGERPTRALPL